MLLAQTLKGTFLSFSQAGLEIFYKPFASFYADIPFMTLQPIQDQIDDSDLAIAALVDNDELIEMTVDAVADAVADAAALALAAADAAADAADAADAAQDTADAAASAISTLGDNVFSPVYTLSPYCFGDVSGGFAAPSFNTAFWLSQFCLMTGLNVKGSVDIPLKAARYRFTLLMVKGSSTGNVTLSVDGNNEGELGGYAAANTNAVLEWIVTISGDGMHHIELKITSHTSPSNGYNLAASQVIIRLD